MRVYYNTRNKTFGSFGYSPFSSEETADLFRDVPEWLAFADECGRATAEIIDVLEHGRIVSAHHLNRDLGEEDLVWPRFYLALDKQEQRAAERVKVMARQRAHMAISDGRITRQPCEVCGAAKAEGHHPDYAKPLELRWLCRMHHDWLHHLGYSIEDMQALEQVAA